MIKVHIRREVTEENQNALMEMVNQLRSTLAGHPALFCGAFTGISGSIYLGHTLNGRHR